MQRNEGFTLVELLIALTILAVGLLAMFVVQIQALADGSRGRHSTTGGMIARDQLELIQRMPYSDPGLAVTAWTTPPWLANGGDPTLAAGEVPTRVAQPGGTVTEKIYTVFYRVTPDAGGNADLRNVDLEVVWDEDGIANNRPTRTGRPTSALSTVLLNNDR